MNAAAIGADVLYLRRTWVQRQFALEEGGCIPANCPGVVRSRDAVAQHLRVGIAAFEIELASKTPPFQPAQELGPIRLKEIPTPPPRPPAPAIRTAQEESFG